LIFKEKYWKAKRNAGKQRKILKRNKKFLCVEKIVINRIETFVFDVQQKNILNVGN